MAASDELSSAEAGGSKSDAASAKRARDEAEKEKRKRTYRACLPCRSRKLRCDLGDSNAPSNGPCARCRRESRDCVFTVKPGSRTYTEGFAPEELQSRPPPPPSAVKAAAAAAVVGAQPTPPSTESSPANGAPSYGSYGSPSTHPPYIPSPYSSYLPPPGYPPTFPPGPSSYRQPRPPLAASYSNPAVPRALTRVGEDAVDRVDSPREEQSSDEEGIDDEEGGIQGEAGRAPGASGAPSAAGAGAARAGQGHILLSAQLHNPGDALRMLATASASAPRGDARTPSTKGGPSPAAESRGRPEATVVAAPAAAASQDPLHEPHQGGWESWQPVLDRVLSQEEGEALLDFFDQAMSPLYPLLSPMIFSREHLPALCSTESFLLVAILAISARYSTSILEPRRATQLHTALSHLIRNELVFILDGSAALRHVSTVEALLLIVEWPTVPIQHGRSGSPGEKAGSEREIVDMLRPSTQYDASSWSYIGCAVRLAQELGLHNSSLYADPEKDDAQAKHKHSRLQEWIRHRYMRTWIHTYNADRHVSVRLGRNTSVQQYMSSGWWETVTTLASNGMRAHGRGEGELWGESALSHAFQAALVGVIQDRLYPNQTVTRALLRTGHWEAFLRSLDQELSTIRRKSRDTLKLKDGNIQSTLLQIEICYITLYGNAVSLRALQERLRRRQKAGDFLFIAPSLLNLQEGPWIIDALAAAQSILQLTVTVLATKGFLRLCPSRIFQRILFAATLLFKGLACGVVEHGRGVIVNLLDETIRVLHAAAIDNEHLPAGFAALLARIQSQCEPTQLSDPNAAPGTAAARPRSLDRTGTHTVAPSRDGSPPPLNAALSASAFAQAARPPPTPQPPTPLPLPPTQLDPQPLPPQGALAPGLDPYAAATNYAAFGHSANGIMSGQEDVATWDTFNWDPSQAALAMGNEQDRLFNALWSVNPGSNPALSLFGTLVGGDLAGDDYAFEM